MSIDFGINQAEMMLLDKGVSDYTKLTDTVTVYQGIKDLRAKRVRMGAIWSYIEPTKPVTDADRNWVDLDRAMIMARRYGLTPHLTVGLVFPSWSPTVTDFGNHCAAIAARYGAGGMGFTFSVEVMNEVNNVGNLSPPTPAHYVPFLKAAYTSIKAVDPSITVVSAGLEPINDGSLGIFGWTAYTVSVSPINFVKGMYAAGAQGYFDALGNHPYSTDLNFNQIPPTPSGTFLAMDDDIYAVMVANGDGLKPIWWTEIGFTIPPLTQQQQNDYLAAQWNIYVTSKPHVAEVFIYNYRCSGTDTSNGNNNYGLVNYDYSKRLAWSFVNTINPGTEVTFGGSGGMTAQISYPARFGGAGGFVATTMPVVPVSATFGGAGGLTAQVFGYPVATFGGSGGMTASVFQGVALSATFGGAGGMTATADTMFRANPTFGGSGGMTATVGQKSAYSYNFDGTGTTKPVTLFTDFGSGYTVNGGVANNNQPTPFKDGYYLSGGIYNQDQVSSNHFAECPTASGAYGGVSVLGFILGASPGFPDRSNVPIVRSNAAGTQFVGAFGHWGGGGSTGVFIVDPNVNGGQPSIQLTSAGAWTSDTDKIRLTADGNTYTVTNTTTGKTMLTWVDVNNVYAGATNRRTGFGLQHIVSNGANYNGPGLGHTWRGEDVRVTQTGASIPVTAIFGGSGQMTAATQPKMFAAATFGGSGGASGVAGLSATFGGSGGMTATVQTVYGLAPLFGGSGGFTAATSMIAYVSATFGGQGSSQGQSYPIDYATATFGGSGAAQGSAYSIPQVSATFGGSGAGSATVTTFQGFSVTTNQTNAAVPAGASGCYVTLLGAGGAGGTGASATGNNTRGGGGGGGGAARVGRDYIPATSLGATYSLNIANDSTTNTVFTSGGVNVTAGSGTNGGNASGANSGAAGAAGTVSQTGVTLSNAGGSAGGKGGSSSTGSTGTSNAVGAGAGGSGGSGSTSGNSTGAVSATTASGGTPTGLNGVGGSGGKSNASPQTGGDGSSYGGGGGGGGGGRGTPGGTGGAGAPGFALIEWVASP